MLNKFRSLLSRFFPKYIEKTVVKDSVECDECGKAILKKSSQKISYFDNNRSGSMYYEKYYCNKHSKPYNHVSEIYVDGRLFISYYYRDVDVEVTQKGKIIKIMSNE